MPFLRRKLTLDISSRWPVDEPLPTAMELGDPVLDRAWSAGQFHELREEDAGIASGFRLRLTVVDESEYAVVFNHIYGYDEVAWIVGSYDHFVGHAISAWILLLMLTLLCWRAWLERSGRRAHLAND